MVLWGSNEVINEDTEGTWSAFPDTMKKTAADTDHADGRPLAILAGLHLQTPKGMSRERYDLSMEELRQLAKSCGLEVVSVVVQHAPAITHSTFFGSGKVTELKNEIDAVNADIVVVNEALTPMQVRNLEEALDTEVLDRTGIILQIFSERARTREARLQVMTAKLQYMLPRLAGMRRNLSRQGGGSGRLSNKGAGEEKLELDRRLIEHRIEEARRQLRAIEEERRTQRSRRLSSGLPRISLVGYTNAGKSTLMNTLISMYGAQTEQKKVFEEDMLFATLDTSVRRIEPPGRGAFLLSDTVGFISDLPTSLIKAFHSTLEEAACADLLLEVVDYSDPSHEMQMQVTTDTLREIGAGNIPVIYVFNKADRTPEVRIPQIHDDRIYMSARQGIGIDELLSLIEQTLFGSPTEATLLVPYSQGSLLHELQATRAGKVLDYTPEGILVRASLRRSDLSGPLARFIAETDFQNG